MRSLLRTALAALTGAAALLAAGCSAPTTGAAPDTTAVKVGLVVSSSGPLAAYGEEYLQGFDAGLAYATGGTGKVGERAIEVTKVDDTGDPAKAVTAAKDLIGKGYTIIGGSVSSGVAVQVAPIAEQNKVLFISGPAATDAITGINKYTFRSGRQTAQDLLTGQSLVPDLAGKKVVVFAPDNVFGQSNVTAIQTALTGQVAGVETVLVPPATTEFTPFALKAKEARPDLLFVVWAGSTAASMWQSLGAQGALDTNVVTGLDLRASYTTYAGVAERLTFISHYFAEAANNPVNQKMIDAVKAAGGTTDLFTPDGFVAAQMVVRAVQQGGGDVDKMISALEGWSFDAPKGRQTIRTEDHAMLQPMFQARLRQVAGVLTPEVVKALTPDEVAPPLVKK
jgi:branched-chain amino acid transport system substrate-binding protein